jgi:peptidoglycan LD-endopeptidase CwlK
MRLLSSIFTKLFATRVGMINTGYKWDTRSTEQLATLHRSLRMVMEDALQLSDVPFQLVEGGRSIARQTELFQAGKSKINPAAYPKYADLYKAAKHIVGPGEPLSRAVDIICATSHDKRYDYNHLCFIAGAVMAAARMRGVRMRWGGNWDGDTEIISDQTFQDLVHFELL